jgi:4-diphosphocytidyl-2-C-methyl-D-erythritol kinase
MSIAPGAYPAPAKLNLLLRVLGRRADGYHLLQTVFRFIDHCDQLHFDVRADGAIVRRNDIPGVASADDLAVRAARLLKARSGSELGADITVEKRLPLGGGLGGGSSDAATTLIALNHLWRLRYPRARLQEIALELGADVPVFVFGAAAIGEGIGEKLTPVELPPAWYVVLAPRVSVATAGVFQHPDLKRDSKPIKIPPFSAAMRRNDLEAVVCGQYPEVARHLVWLRQFGSAAMTGSGACVFAEFATETEARKVFGWLPETMQGFVARGLDRHPLWDYLT